MTLKEIIDQNPDNVAILMGFGMHCIGCPFSQMETLEEACAVHGLDLDFVLAKLNELNVDGELSQDEKNN